MNVYNNNFYTYVDDNHNKMFYGITHCDGSGLCVDTQNRKKNITHITIYIWVFILELLANIRKQIQTIFS